MAGQGRGRAGGGVKPVRRRGRGAARTRHEGDQEMDGIILLMGGVFLAFFAIMAFCVIVGELLDSASGERERHRRNRLYGGNEGEGRR